METMPEHKKSLNEIKELKKNASSDLSLFFENARKSFLFYKNEQYEPSIREELKRRGLPALVINIIKQVVNSLSGHERQNKTDIMVRPIESSDDRLSEVLSRTIKWVMSQRLHEFVGSDIFKDTVICGLGWWGVYIDYLDDPINGDIKIKQCSVFDILFDPQMKEKDLSDCRYLIYECRIDKKELINRFPEYKEKIKQLEPGERRINDYKEASSVNAKDKGLVVTEYWYRHFEKKNFILQQNGMLEEFVGDEDEMQVLKDSGTEFVKKEVPSIKLKISIEDMLLVYDGDNPYGLSYYPYVPDFGYYELSYSDWHIKLQGEVEALRDVNIEKNKRRSQMAAVMAKSVHSGFFAEESSVKNPDDLVKSGGAGKLIYYQRGKQPPKQIIPQEIPNSLLTLEQLTSGDQYQVGIKSDLMGIAQEKGAPLGLSQLRMKQGVSQVQELFDNHSLSKQLVGRILIEAITRNFEPEKIKRILGTDLPFEKQKQDIAQKISELERFVPKTKEEGDAFFSQTQELEIQMLQIQKQENEFWEAWEDAKTNSTYDCFVDESAQSPTYRMGSLSLLMSMLQSGVDVPIEMIIELSDVPKSLKDKLVANMMQKSRAQQAIAEREQNRKDASEDLKNKVELIKAFAGMAGNEQLAGQIMQMLQGGQV